MAKHGLYRGQNMTNPQMCWNCADTGCAKGNDREDSCGNWKAVHSCDDINCCECGRHKYDEKVCECGETFCCSCCDNTNVDQGGKYEADFMNCPKCGKDYYSEGTFLIAVDHR